VRADVRVNPCLAISPPLICDRGHVDELAAAVSAGLEAVA
jgi:adenosylmethionine-8-amino-7-oxononanoate aminotransferase